MARPQTHTVQQAYIGRDGKPRCFVKGHTPPLFTDEILNEGDAVVIRDGRAVRP